MHYFHPQRNRLRQEGGRIGYKRCVRHYKWALDLVFLTLGYRQAIIIEGALLIIHYSDVIRLDDMEVSPDIFAYFAATLPLLRADPTLVAISAWNDNGQPQHASDPNIF